MAYNALNDNTKSYLQNTDTAPGNVNVNANSSGKVYAVGAGVAVSGTENALNGSVAVKGGSNSTQAVLDNVKSNAVNNINVNASDSVKKVAVVGGLTIAGGSVAVGGSVAYNIVGTSDYQQLTKVSMQGNDINASGNVSVNANDTSDLLTVGVGIGGSGKVAVQGSAAVATLNKDVGISLDNSSINAKSVSLNANTAEDLITTADVLSIGGNVGVGSDSAVVNRQVNASLDTGNTDSTAKDVNVRSNNQQGIGSLIAGIGFAGAGVGASNGVGVSLVDGSTNASVSNTKGKFDNLNVTADHLLNLNTLGVSFGAAGTGAGVDLSVDVFKTTDKTTTAVKNSDITLANDANVKATNNANVDYQMYDVGAAAVGAGLAGSIGVANVQNNVSTDIVGSNLTTNNKANIAAQNNLDFENKAAVGGLAGLGGGVGIGVSVNTLDSSVNANVNGGSLNASEIDLKSVENRNINQGVGVVAAGAGAAASANIMITNVGKELDSSYESDTNKDKSEKDGTQVNVNEHINKANESSVNKLAKGDNLKSGGMNIELVSNADKKVTAGGSQNSGTHINISGNLNADKISVNNLGTNNMRQGLFTGSAGGVSANGAVGILNFKRNASTAITGNITANDLTINNQDSGESEQEILQGGFGLGAAVNASYGRLNVTGKNNIKIEGNTLDAATLNISNSDLSRVNVESKGVSASLGRATGVLIAEGSLDSSNDIEINNATLTGKTISISGKAAPEVSVDGLAASASATFAGSGLFAGSINNSAAKIFGDGATFTSDNLSIYAENLSAVKTSTDSISGSLLASGSLTGILNRSNAAAAVDFTNATVNAPNTSFNVNSLPNQKVGLVSLGAGGLMAATGSVATVTSNPSATVNVSAKEITADDLTMNATATGTPDISVKGYSVGAIAVGSNLIASARDVKVDASLKADNATLNNLDINAKNVSVPNLNVNGDGGGLAGIAPAAAVLNDNLTQSASVKLGGTLNVKNSVNVNAQNSDAGTYTADALGAAVVGASGVNLTRNADSKAVINFDAANIKSDGTQTTGNAESLNNGGGRRRIGHKLFRRRNDLRQSNQREQLDADE